MKARMLGLVAENISLTDVTVQIPTISSFLLVMNWVQCFISKKKFFSTIKNTYPSKYSISKWLVQSTVEILVKPGNQINFLSTLLLFNPSIYIHGFFFHHGLNQWVMWWEVESVFWENLDLNLVELFAHCQCLINSGFQLHLEADSVRWYSTYRKQDPFWHTHLTTHIRQDIS